MIGQTVSHYRIVEKIGGGGMGEVFKAEDLKLGRFVALKFLAETVSRDRTAVERFNREARAAAALSHPHICTIHEINEHEGLPYLVMEFLEGRTLRVAIGGRPLPLETAVDLAIQVTEALAMAHGKGIVHRDIKPSNIFVTPSGNAKVLDFGLAKQAAQVTSLGEGETIGADAPTESMDITAEGSAPGTVSYMSPEQAMGEEVDLRSDFFSLGAVIYEMVTGRQAFTGPTQAAIFDRILHQDPPSPARLGVSCPVELEVVLKKTMERNRAFRYQNAIELHTDLKRVMRELHSGSVSGVQAAAVGGEVRPRDASDSSVAVPIHPGPPSSSVVTTIAPAVAGKRSRAWMIAAASAVVLVGLAAVFWRQPAPQQLAESDVLLLTDLDNSTGDPVFDGTLKQALAVKLEESPYLNVLPERQVQDALRFMNRSPDERITPELGQEICERQGIKAMVTGEIAPLGNDYVITLAALECLSGNSLAREQVQVANKEDVLAAVGEAAAEIRRELGESLASIERFDAPVEQTTTSSLEALKAFSLGEEQRTRGAEEDAIVFFKRAIELDPEFALAHGRLGTIYFNLGESNVGLEHKRRAFELRERVSERERLYITAHYYASVTGELDREIEAYELFKRTYPRFWTPPNNLADSYSDTGQFERAIDEAREALRLNPGHPLPYANLTRAYLNAGRTDAAKEVLAEASTKSFVHYEFLVRRFEIAFLEGKQEAMRGQMKAAEGKPAEARLLALQAGAFASRGRLDEARTLTARAVEVAQRFNFPELSANFAASGAATEAIFGIHPRAREQARRALAIARTRDAMTTAATALALAEAPEEAEAIIAELAERFPTDTLIQEVELPIARAAIALEDGEYGLALEELESIAPYERAFLDGIYLRGLALVASGAAEEGAVEFRKILQLEGVAPTSPVHTLAHLGLARALALADDTVGSRAIYETFLALLADGDEDLPVLREARAELAALP